MRVEELRARLSQLLALAARRCSTDAKPGLVHSRTRSAATGCWRANETVTWHRAHQARALRQVAGEQRRLGPSRERYWGTTCRCALRRRATSHCIGSYEELRERYGVELAEPAQSLRDDSRVPLPRLRRGDGRVPEVIRRVCARLEPLRQYTPPFENQDEFEAQLAPPSICEALTRRAAESLLDLAVSTLLSSTSSRTATWSASV